MHPAVQQRVDGLAALRLRSSIAAAEFYAMIGKEPPAQPPRFTVKLVGRSFCHIVENSTGKVKGFRRNHNEACALARKLEDSADGITATLSCGAPS